MEKISKAIMHDRIQLALKDKNNGSLQTIYARIRRTGSPFKTGDRRCKYGTAGVVKDTNGISKQLISQRLRHGWSIEDACNIPPKATGRRKHEQDIREDLPNSVLAQ